MSEETKAAKPKKHYIVHTTGGEPLRIPAHDYVINREHDRVYFLDKDENVIETWIVFLRNVAAIEITDPPMAGMGRLRM